MIAGRLKEKIRYFESDLRLDPKNEALLFRLVHAYAALALALRDDHRAEAEAALKLARDAQRRRLQAYPRAVPSLNWVNEDLDRFIWSGDSNGMMLPQMMTSRPGAGMGPMAMLNGPVPGEAPGPMLSRPPIISSPPQGFAPGSLGPAATSMPMPLAGTQDSLEQEKSLRNTIAACLARRGEDPDDLNNLDALGAAYERMANLEQDPRKRRSSTNLKMALEVFTDAARRARLHIHKATFLQAAGEVYGQLGDAGNQYRMAKLACEQAPFSPAVWDELQDAALRAGRFADSRIAARKAHEWTLPTVQAPPVVFSPPASAPAP